MKRTGTLFLPLHRGKTPRWLFERMKRLSLQIISVIIEEFGTAVLLEKLSSPLWFQAFGCVLGFDWHSSGLTTTVCGALKEALKKQAEDLGIFVCGGKGGTSRKTPQELIEWQEKLCIDTQDLIYASRMSAKIDNNCLQDGFNLYHHVFMFDKHKNWIVIQQGMSEEGWARRYHWSSQKLKSFTIEPHSGIISKANLFTLNLVDKDMHSTQELIVQLSHRPPSQNIKDINCLLTSFNKLPSRHRILLKDINVNKLKSIYLKTYESKPQDFEKLIAQEGVGPKTLRALALISELIYGAPLSFRDPARFSFAHGGKDGVPYKVNKKQYDTSIDILEKAVKKARLGYTDRLKALRTLYKFYNKEEVKE